MTSNDGGITWDNYVARYDVPDVYVQIAATHTVQDSKEYIASKCQWPRVVRKWLRSKSARVEEDGEIDLAASSF